MGKPKAIPGGWRIARSAWPTRHMIRVSPQKLGLVAGDDPRPQGGSGARGPDLQPAKRIATGREEGPRSRPSPTRRTITSLDVDRLVVVKEASVGKSDGDETLPRPCAGPGRAASIKPFSNLTSGPVREREEEASPNGPESQSGRAQARHQQDLGFSRWYADNEYSDLLHAGHQDPPIT